MIYIIKGWPSIILVIGLLMISSCKVDKSVDIDHETASIPITVTPKIAQLSAQLTEDGLNDKLRFDRAQALYEEGLYNEAIEDLRIAITVDSLQPQYYHLLSDVFMDSNNSSKALQTMKVVANLFPQRTMTQLKLSETYLILTQYDESITVLNRILQYDPTNAEAYLMLGMNFREMGDTERALNSFQTATEFDSKIVDAWIAIGNILDAQDNPRAAKYFETAINIEPDNIFALHSLAFYQQNHNNIDRAISTYQQMISIDKHYSDAYLNVGILYLEQGNFSLAKENFSIFASQQTLDPRGYFYQGYLAFQEGDIPLAKTMVENALNLSPDYQNAIDLKVELDKIK